MLADHSNIFDGLEGNSKCLGKPFEARGPCLGHAWVRVIGVGQWKVD